MIDRYVTRSTSMERYIIPLGMLSLFSILTTSNAVDTINETKFLADGETLVSSGGIFELGFFSPGSSKNRYVGIWYKRISNTTVVWVANREIPLSDKSGVLKLTSPGILVLVNSTNATIWSSDTSISAQVPIAQLFDSGNFVVRNANDEMKEENFLWQSFDYPGNTVLPGMKMGKNSLTGRDKYYSSWKSDDDPAQGNYTCGFDTRGYPQVILRKGIIEGYRSGPWNGVRFSGSTHSGQIFMFNHGYRFNYTFDTEGVYYTYNTLNSSVVSRSVLSHNGSLGMWTWIDPNRTWLLFKGPVDYCDGYATCSYYGSCNMVTSPICGCLDKFVPKYPKDWELFDWSNGCIRRTPLDCHDDGGDGFVKYSKVKLPDTRSSWFNVTMTLEECGRTCLRNCSCMAYANLDIREGGSGCLLWFGDLIDIKVFGGEGDGQDIYVRMASSELDSVNKTPGNKSKDSRSKRTKWIILAIVVSMSLLTIGFFYCKWRRKLQKRDPTKCGILNWELRVKIIQGIAQGLLYLHEYSRVRIIHRDLKASNILLDKDMNPKISDFGMARIFGGNGSQATNRIVGTYGYMSPEYAFKGLFSIKSDVFSFGVLLLEIPSGKRNTGFHADSLSLLGYAWDLWKSNRGQDVKDPVLEHISSTNMLMRYIHIGLLCVQESAIDRPTMPNVITMLSNEASLLPSPKQPTFVTSKDVRDQTSPEHPEICSANDMTISILKAR